MIIKIFPDAKDDGDFSGEIIAAIQRLCVGRCVSYSAIGEKRPVPGLPNFLQEVAGVEIWISGKDQPEPIPHPPQESTSWRDRPPLL